MEAFNVFTNFRFIWMSSYIWTDFWKGESQSFFKIMRMSTHVFANRFTQTFHYKNTKILDFGCGPGFLVELLVNQDCEITGFDINESFIQICHRNFPDHVFSVIDADVASLRNSLNKQTQTKLFDFIILLSISQYYDSRKEFESVIKTLAFNLKKGGTLIIADVISKNTSRWKDLTSVFSQSILSGNLFNLISFILYLLFSRYQKATRQAPLLTFEDEFFKNLAISSHLSFQKLKNMTLHPTRNTYALISTRESR